MCGCLCEHCRQIPKTHPNLRTNSWLRFRSESLVNQGDVHDGDHLLVLGINILGIKNIKSFALNTYCRRILPNKFVSALGLWLEASFSSRHSPPKITKQRVTLFVVAWTFPPYFQSLTLCSNLIKCLKPPLNHLLEDSIQKKSNQHYIRLSRVFALIDSLNILLT